MFEICNDKIRKNCMKKIFLKSVLNDMIFLKINSLKFKNLEKKG